MLTGRQSTLTAQIVQRTLLLSLIAVVAIVLAFGGIAAATFSAAQRDVNDIGADAAREFDLFLTAIESDLQAVAASLGVPDAVEQGLRAALQRHDEIFELSYFDPYGNVIAQRRRGAVMGSQFVTERPWLESVQVDETYIGTVNFEEFGVPFVDLAVPVRTASGELTGALVARLDLTALWQTVIAIEVGHEGYAYIVDESGQLLVYADLEQVQQGVNTVGAFGLLPGEINAASPLGLGLLNTYNGLTDQLVVGSSRALASVPWYAVVEQPTYEAVEPFVPLFAALVLALAGSVALVVMTVQFLRRRVTSPLQDVIEGAQVLASGDLSYRVEPRGARELQVLGSTLNQMADELEQINRTLEERVQERTRDLELAARVASQVSTILDPDVLLPQVVDLTKDYFKLYHSHVYLLDEDGDNLVLTAGAGEAGRVMLERGHRIPASAEASIVARAAREKEPVIVADTTTDPAFLANPLLPETRSEAAFPLLAGERVLGVLDVQSEQPGRFDSDLITVLSTMASQIGVALDNANLFSTVERARRHERAVSAITQAIQQATSLDEVLQVAARELGRALRVPRTAIELKLDTVHTRETRTQPTK